jgi:hypothetical protein
MSKIVEQMVSLLISVIGGSTVSSKKPVSTSPPAPKIDGDYYIWKKGDTLVLSKYFGTAEFSCHCNFSDCKEQRISKSLITKLDKIREAEKQPLIVTSAFRCTKYQAVLRASGVNTVVAKLSQHELGNAADIVPKDQKNVRTTFLDICAKEFDSIGLSDKFLHCDLRLGKRRWNY